MKTIGRCGYGRRVKALTAVLLVMGVLAAVDLSFSATDSEIVMAGGQEKIVLDGGAHVDLEDFSIDCTRIELTGASYDTIKCNGTGTIGDRKNGLLMRMSHLWFDRIEQRMLISSYMELEDRAHGVFANAKSMEYRLEEEIVFLKRDCSLSWHDGKNTLSAKCDRISYDMTQQKLHLKDDVSMKYMGSSYLADEVILDMETGSLEMHGNITASVTGK